VQRATHSLLKEFGFGKASALEQLIVEELKVFTKELKSQINYGTGVIEIKHQFQTIFMNVVWSLLMGSRFQHDDPKLQHILELNRAYTGSAQIGGGIVGLFPELLYMAPDWTGYTQHMGVSRSMRTFMEVIHCIHIHTSYQILSTWDKFPLTYGQNLIYWEIHLTSQEIIAGYRKQGTYKTAPSNFIECFLQLIDKHGEHYEDAQALDSIYSRNHEHCQLPGS